jgi:diguanylate cyclase (GGDEF)-like protein
LDIDHFKIVNDTFSYALGDQVLRSLAVTLRANLREIDLIGRYGGEEFIVLLPDTDAQSAMSAAERLRQSVAAMRVKTGDVEISITVSVGVTQKSTRLTGLDALIHRAGQALQEAKKLGRNQVVVLL